MHAFIGLLYKLVGRLLLRRRCYVTVCTWCRQTREERYHPYHGAFLWEREYWMPFRPNPCCWGTQAVVRSYDGLVGALYRLPGYKAWDEETFRRLVTKAPVKEG